MIYLIGGPPKSGKTTLAKYLAKKLRIQWVSSDTLQVIGRKYSEKNLSKNELKNLYPHTFLKGTTNDETYSKMSPKDIVKNYSIQAKATYDAIDMFSICEITDGNEYVIEGYHVTPQLVTKLEKKYGAENFRSIFLVKHDKQKILKDIHKSKTPNDWILRNTKKEETFEKIAEMISLYSAYFEKQVEKYGGELLCIDTRFSKKIREAVKLLK